MSRPTISDVAKRAGVSKGAASFALNGRPGVSEETRARVLRVAAELNWRPHSAARALGGKSSGVVGLVFARPARTLGVEPFFAQLISGLQAELSASSVGLELLIVEDTDAELAVYRRWAADRHVDGVVLVDLKVRDPRVAPLEVLGLPSLVLGGPGGHGSLSSVWVDDRRAMLDLLSFLRALGHRRIGHIAGPPDLVHTHRRRRAARDASRKFGLTVTTATTDFSDATGAEGARLLLAAPDRPTALVFDSDVMAVAGLGACAEAGLAVPGDVSIASFDDSILARVVHPALTALTRDTFALGCQLGEALLAEIAEPGRSRRIQAPTPQVVERASTSARSGWSGI